ncbi:MAG TPA: LPXTG cell wall anchor domain-containing protein [Micromonosporaceae bacterium]
MNFRKRVLASLGAGALGLTAASAFATPALADAGVDVAIESAGGTIGDYVSSKPIKVTLVNKHATEAAENILVKVDTNGLLPGVKFDGDECGGIQDDGFVYCGIEGDALPAGARIDWSFWLELTAGDAGDYGKIKITIEHDGEDPDLSNNSTTLDIKVAKKTGPDLAVIAYDVDSKVEDRDEDEYPVLGGALHPGEEGAVLYDVANFGDEPAWGVRVTVNLPEGVTFTEVEPDCAYSDDNRKAVCTYPDLTMISFDDWAEGKEGRFGVHFWNYVTVAAGVKAPVTLTEGMVTVEALEPQLTVLNKSTKAALPENARPLTEDREFGEIDPSDNSDKFNVIVAGSGGEGGGSLPVTGAQAGLIGGIGAAVVIAGAALFLMARRRKVVLVTPDDEKSSN